MTLRRAPEGEPAVVARYSRIGAPRARGALKVAVACLVLAGCTVDFDTLLQLGESADQYFNSWEFLSDLNQLGDFIGKSMGS